LRALLALFDIDPSKPVSYQQYVRLAQPDVADDGGEGGVGDSDDSEADSDSNSEVGGLAAQNDGAGSSRHFVGKPWKFPYSCVDENDAFTSTFAPDILPEGDGYFLLHHGLFGGILAHLGCSGEHVRVCCTFLTLAHTHEHMHTPQPQLSIPAWRAGYMEALTTHFLNVFVYRKLKLTIAGNDRALLFRAHPSVEGTPWFDFVQVLMQEPDADGEDVGRMHVARCMGFVHLRPRRLGTQAKEQHFVLVQWFVSASQEVPACAVPLFRTMW